MAIILTEQLFFTVILSVTLIVLIIAYRSLYPKMMPEDPSRTWPPELRLKEYDYLNSEVERRERSMIMMGSIFLPVCFFLMGTAAIAQNLQARLVIVGLSITLYSVWLFMIQLTTWNLANLTLARLRWIENRAGFEVHRFALRKTENSRMMTVRRHHWFLYLIALFIVGIFIINLPITAQDPRSILCRISLL